MSGMSSDAQMMESAAAQIHEVKDNIKHVVSTLQSQIDPVLQSWEGGAADVFKKLMVKFTENVDKINAELATIGENIQETGRDNVQNDEMQSSEMSKIEGLLNL